MTSNRCLLCGDTKTHGGNKKLADLHSKFLQKQFAEEQARLEKLNGAKTETKAVVLPVKEWVNKAGVWGFL